MISVEKLVYDFYRKYNANNSGRNKKIPIVDVISYLNEALEIWFENKVFITETNQKIRNDLRQLEIKKYRIEVERIDDKCVIAKYPKDFYQLLNQIAVVSSDCCDENKELIVRVVQSDDLQEARRNPYRKTDFKWEQLISDEAGEGLYLYEDKALNVECVFIDYIRKPKYLDAPELLKCGLGKYVNYSGQTITINSDFEIDATFANRQVSDLAVLLISRDLNNLAGFNSQASKILQVEKLYRT